MGTKRRATEVVQAARGRLKGALQDVINVTEDEEDADSSLPTRGRPKKLKLEKKEPTPPPQSVHHTFIMKLFDRSVDLAKYNENTALYPICRAWILNQPRSTKIVNFCNREIPEPIERKPLPNLLGDIESGEVTEVTAMPACNSVEISRVPSPLPFQKDISKDKIDLNYDISDPPFSRDELLDELKEKWSQVRKKWQTHSKEYEEKKYGQSMKILDALYKR